MAEDAVRYDEKIGLLPPVKRKANGHVFRGNEAVPQPAGTDRSLG
ncbi:hypothetical protein NSS75_21500 [Bacillus sp. FSL K6-1012]